jgi:hypothetical protein
MRLLTGGSARVCALALAAAAQAVPAENGVKPDRIVYRAMRAANRAGEGGVRALAQELLRLAEDLDQRCRQGKA